MSIQLAGNGGTIAEVDGTSHRAMRASIRPLEHTTLGHYKVAAQSGLLTGTGVTAGGTLFSMRWGDATRFAVITRLKAKLVVVTKFTAVQEFGLDAIIARSFSASDSAGTALTLTGNNQKSRTNMGTSLVSDMRIGAATILTAGTRTLDANPFAIATGLTHDVNAAAATEQSVAIPVVLDWEADPARGEYPIVLAQNEGIILRNVVVFPAAGDARLNVELAWAEVAAY